MKTKLVIYLPTPRSNKFVYAVTCPYCYHGWGSNNKDNVCPKCKGIFSDDDFQQRLLNFGKASRRTIRAVDLRDSAASDNLSPPPANH